jgi:hypothetical protein
MRPTCCNAATLIMKGGLTSAVGGDERERLIPRFVAGLALLMPLSGAAAQSGSDYVTGFPRESVHVQARQGGKKNIRYRSRS